MSDTKPTRDAQGRILPGATINPKGFNGEMRGKLHEVAQLAQKFTKEAIEGLVKIGRDKKAPALARVNAWNSVLDRAFGKPAQAVDLSNSDGSLASAWAAARAAIEEEPAEPHVEH